jgi:hypothetical protein
MHMQAKTDLIRKGSIIKLILISNSVISIRTLEELFSIKKRPNFTNQ